MPHLLLLLYTLAALLAAASGDEPTTKKSMSLQDMAMGRTKGEQHREWTEADKIDIQNQITAKGQAELKKTDELGRTPLHVAAYFGLPIVMEALLKAGAQTCCLNLIEAATGSTPLLLAVSSPHEDEIAPKVKMLVEYGAQVNVQNSKGETPLHLAAQKGLVSVIKVLSKAGAALNVQTGPAHTPLHLAAMAGKVAAIQALAAAGADLNQPDQTGHRALHAAVFKNQSRSVRALAKAGADLEVVYDLKDKKRGGATPLQLAVQQRHMLCVVALVEAGADIHAEANGISPMELAGTSEEYLRALTRTKRKAKDEL